MEKHAMTKSNQLPDAHRPLTDQLVDAKAAADAAHAVEQRCQTDWGTALWSMAGNVHALCGNELMDAMNRLNQLAQEVYAAHQEAAIADKVLAGMAELVNRRRNADC
jgi:hypothetical protein